MDIKTSELTYNHLNYLKPNEQTNTFVMHTHDTYELIYFEKGQATYVIENRKYKLKKNDLIFIRPMKYHYVEVKPNSEYSRINIAFSSSFVGKNLCETIPPQIEVINCPPQSIVANIINRMEYYSKNLDETSFSDILSALLKEMLYCIQMISKEESVKIPSQVSNILTEAIDYINENLFTIKEIKEVSSKFFISEQYFYHLFRTQLKISPKKYLNIKRLMHAQKMIQQGYKPIEVYSKCGFESYVGFYKQYIKTFGYSPSHEKDVVKI